MILFWYKKMSGPFFFGAAAKEMGQLAKEATGGSFDRGEQLLEERQLTQPVTAEPQVVKKEL